MWLRAGLRAARVLQTRLSNGVSLAPTTTGATGWTKAPTIRAHESQFGVRVMGGRSENLFKRNDVMRAIKSARDAGVPVAGVEISCKDGTTIRVFGEKLAQMADNSTGWDDAIAELEKQKVKPKAKGKIR